MHTISRATTDFAGVALYGISDPRTAKQYPNSMARLSVQRHGIASLFASLTEATKKSAYFGCDVYICNYTNGQTISLYGQSETCCPFKVVLDPARQLQGSGSHVKIGHLIELPPADRSDIRVWLKPERSTGNKPNKSGSSTSGSGSSTSGSGPSVKGWSKANPFNWPQMYRDTDFKRLMGLSTANSKENDEAERIMDRAMKEATDDEELSKAMIAAGALGGLLVSGLALYAWRQSKAKNGANGAAPAAADGAAAAAAGGQGAAPPAESGETLVERAISGAKTAVAAPGEVLTEGVKGAVLSLLSAVDTIPSLSGLKSAVKFEKNGTVVFGSLAGATLLFELLGKTKQPLGPRVIASMLGALVAGMATKKVNALLAPSRGQRDEFTPKGPQSGVVNGFRSRFNRLLGVGAAAEPEPEEAGEAGPIAEFAAEAPAAVAEVSAEERAANIRGGERGQDDLGRLQEQHLPNDDDDAVGAAMATAPSPPADGAVAADPEPAAAPVGADDDAAGAGMASAAQASMADASPERVKRAGADDTGSGFSKKGVNTKRARKGR